MLQGHLSTATHVRLAGVCELHASRAVIVSQQEAAQMVGKKIAELCLSMNIDKVCFDRGGNVYHGRVQVCTRRLVVVPYMNL